MIGLTVYRVYNMFLLYTKRPWERESVVRIFIHGKIVILRCNTKYETKHIKKILTKENIKFSEDLLRTQAEEDDHVKRRISPTNLSEVFSGVVRTWADLRIDQSNLERVKRILRSQGYWIVYSVRGGIKILR